MAFARFTALAVATALLSACGTAHIATLPVKKAATTAAKTLKAAPSAHVIESTTVVAVAPDAATVNLEFSLQPDGAVRSLQAVNDIEVAAAPGTAAVTAFAAQIDHVVFTVTYAGGAAPLIYTVSKAQFLSGKAVVQFNNLPAGHLVVTAAAFDAANKQLVTANGEGDIKIGELTQVKLKCVVPAAPGVGHVRLEMDCWSEGCGPVPTPVPTGFVPFPIDDVRFRSLGDPHEEGANGLVFENQQTGTFMSMRTLTNDFMLVKHQAPATGGRWPGTTVNDAVAIQSNGDVFKWLLSGRRILMNGAVVPAKAGMAIRGAHGTVVNFIKMDADLAVCEVTSTQGDKVTIEDRADFINLIGTISATRVVHEVRGEFGTFNNGTPQQGMLLRDGSQAPNLNAFLTNWKADASEDLFKDGPAIVLTR
ncbi:MAG: C-type lectin domain protein [Cyanobacteria bacterium RYN_339]|nr:C-type lectin domain protein [Cyanobacteria bacterium RYN_339]